MSKEEKIIEGARTAFINSDFHSNLAYKPEFITNNYKEGKKVLSSIEDELLRCDRFQISVAFITEGGIEPLLSIFKELEKKNVSGQILTTNYLSFSEPKALKKLSELSNITIKMYDSEKAGCGFHTKAYIFEKDNVYRIIVGSSNLTDSALSKNKEWNTKIVSSESGEMAQNILKEFDVLWNSEYAFSFDTFFEEYKEKYEIVKKQRALAREEKITSIEKYRLTPNSMQVGFINNLKKLIEAGEDKALLISATGTGKTYASAFAMRELGFKRVLFVVHRAQLAKQTRKSYGRVFSNKVSMGFIGDGKFDCDSEYLFATVQTLNKDEYLNRFNPQDFDCIILDEAHHSSAGSYQRIMNYFKPKLFLGMTATPDKRDDNIEGRNIYEIFNHNIVYEIRLQQAMQEDLLCPFHYFGITDLRLIGDLKTGKKLSERDFNLLTSDERINHIIKQANYFGYSGDRVKGLIFCSRINEAEALSEKFNSTINPETGRCFRTISLDGSANAEQRQEAFERLAMDENDGSGREPLDYIFSVEILNEGVDIVEVNQVIMLRPTQSPIVFVQQLGRGLRKADGKEFVVIIDFIGNYNNNFMIPIALSGDRTYNKDNIIRNTINGSRIIPGVSSIHFDEISRQRIFDSVENNKFNSVELIKSKYLDLKTKLGRIPSLMDFDIYGELDVVNIFSNSSLGSYYTFLKKYEKEYLLGHLNETEENIIKYVSRKFADGKRLHELLVLKHILEQIRRLDAYRTGIFGRKKSMFDVSIDLKEILGNAISDLELENIENIFTNRFQTGVTKDKYPYSAFLVKRGESIFVNPKFIELLSNEDFYAVLFEVVEFGIARNKRDYSETYKDTNFSLYKKYSMEDICRLMNWKQNVVAQNLSGYFCDKRTKTQPVFVNYIKDDSAISYRDRFVDNKTLISISKKKRTLESEDVRKLIHSTELGIDTQLFVRKRRDENVYYYLGRIFPTGNNVETKMPDGDVSIVEMEWSLDVPVREDVYTYLTSESVG